MQQAPVVGVTSMAQTSNQLQIEATIFSKYLIKREPSIHAVDLYTRAMQNNLPAMDDTDEKLFSIARSYPFMLRFLDSGLVFVKPTSELRRRLFVLFSILESSPEYTNHFLPKKHSLFYIFVLIFSGLIAVIQAIVGVCAVKVITR